MRATEFTSSWLTYEISVDCTYCINPALVDLGKRNPGYGVFIKVNDSAFYSPADNDDEYDDSQNDLISGSLADYLHRQGINDLVLIGAFDCCCVKQTWRDAELNGFNVTVIHDLNIPFKLNHSKYNLLVEDARNYHKAGLDSYLAMEMAIDFNLSMETIAEYYKLESSEGNVYSLLLDKIPLEVAQEYYRVGIRNVHLIEGLYKHKVPAEVAAKYNSEVGFDATEIYLLSKYGVPVEVANEYYKEDRNLRVKDVVALYNREKNAGVIQRGFSYTLKAMKSLF